MGVESIVGAVVPSIIGGIFGEDTPSAPTPVSASNSETRMQATLGYPLSLWANQNLNEARAQSNVYDTNKLQLQLDPTLIDLQRQYQALGTYNQGLASETPTLTKNFATLNKDDIYSGLMADVNRQAAEQKAQNREQLMESGIADSTILSNVNNRVNQNVLSQSTDAAAKAAQMAYESDLQSKQLSNQAALTEDNYRRQGIKDYTNSMFTIGNNRLGISDKISQNDLYNKNLDYNEFIRQQNATAGKVANIISLFNGQSGIQSTAMNNANAMNLANYQNQVAATRDQNQTIANVASQLFKPTNSWGSGK